MKMGDFLRLLSLFFLLCTNKKWAKSQPISENVQCALDCFMDTGKRMKTVKIGNNGKTFEELSWVEIFEDKPHPEGIVRSFEQLCGVYYEHRNCTSHCRETSRMQLLQKTFAGYHYICVVKRNEFFSALPCLARTEQEAMNQCRPEIRMLINATLGLRRLSEQLKQEQHIISKPRSYSNKIQAAMDALCRATLGAFGCMEPRSRVVCGPEPTQLMEQFVAHSLENFDALYEAVWGKDKHKQPNSCARLVRRGKLTEVERKTLEKSMTSKEKLDWASQPVTSEAIHDQSSAACRCLLSLQHYLLSPFVLILLHFV